LYLPAEGKVFFFEKKKQKTFINWDLAKCQDPVHRPKVPKVFCFFFSKREDLPLPSLHRTVARKMLRWTQKATDGGRAS